MILSTATETITPGILNSQEIKSEFNSKMLKNFIIGFLNMFRIFAKFTMLSSANKQYEIHLWSKSKFQIVTWLPALFLYTEILCQTLFTHLNTIGSLVTGFITIKTICALHEQIIISLLEVFIY